MKASFMQHEHLSNMELAEEFSAKLRRERVQTEQANRLIAQLQNHFFPKLGISLDLKLGLKTNWDQEPVIAGKLIQLTREVALSPQLKQSSSHDTLVETVRLLYRLSGVEPDYTKLVDAWAKELIRFIFSTRPAVNILLIEPRHEVLYVVNNSRHTAPDHSTATAEVLASGEKPVYEVIGK